MFSKIICAAAALSLFMFMPASMAADGGTASTGPKLEYVQLVTNGMAGVTKMNGIASVQIVGNFLYVSSGADGWITWFKCDSQTGKLTFAGEQELGQRLWDAFPAFRNAGSWGFLGTRGVNLTSAGGHLYALPMDGSGMSWFDIDPTTGALTEKGMVECPPSNCHVTLSPDKKDLYAKYQPGPHHDGRASVTRYRLAADGKPLKDGIVDGEALGVCAFMGCNLLMTPDGKNLYVFCGFEKGPGFDLVGIERKAGGEIARKNVAHLDDTIDPTHIAHPVWMSLDASPDSKWIYASFVRADQNRCVVLKRDSETGDLAHQAGFNDGINGRKTVFLPDGSGGYMSIVGALTAFTFDASTGHMKETRRLKEAEGQTPLFLVHDTENGFLYAGTRNCIFVAQTDKTARQK